jgi:hypothetical protein
MTSNALQFLRSFKALAATDQREVLIQLLREPIEAEYEALSDSELLFAAEEVFLALDDAEKSS